MAIEKYDADLSALMKTCEEMKKLYSGILVILDLLFLYLIVKDGWSPVPVMSARPSSTICHLISTSYTFILRPIVHKVTSFAPGVLEGFHKSHIVHVMYSLYQWPHYLKLSTADLLF